MNKLIITLSLALITAFNFAQTLQEALIKTDNERFDAAAVDFRALIAKELAKGDYYFYFGENYFQNGVTDKNEALIDSANIFFAKGAEVNATNPLNYVGLGKVLLYKNNVADAKTQFFKAASVAQNKNAEVMRQTAKAWLSTDNKNADEAINQANLAIKLEPKNAEGYIILGDAQLEKTPADGGPAIKSYKMATSLNLKSPKGILREGKLYQRGRNYQLALDKYKEAIVLDPNYAPAYREIAELYYMVQQNSKSIENWKKYLELNNSNEARYRFFTALFRNKQYIDAIKEYESLKKTSFKSVYLDRIAAYSYYEMGNKSDTTAYLKGSNAIGDFFNNAGSNFKYIGTDYKYKGLLLLRLGKDSLARIEMEKAVALDPTLAPDINSELAKSAMKAKKYDKVINFLEKKMDGDTKNLNNNDFFDLGKAYYFLGQNKLKESNTIKDVKLKQAKIDEGNPIFIKADTAFANLTRLSPTWPIGYTWRGRTNSLLDPKNEKDIAKEQYQKVISTIIKPEEKVTYKNNIIEALEFLGYYHVTKKDKAKADETFNQLKELDINNEKVKNYFAPQKSGGAKPGGK